MVKLYQDEWAPRISTFWDYPKEVELIDLLKFMHIYPSVIQIDCWQILYHIFASPKTNPETDSSSNLFNSAALRRHTPLIQLFLSVSIDAEISLTFQPLHY